MAAADCSLVVSLFTGKRSRRGAPSMNIVWNDCTSSSTARSASLPVGVLCPDARGVAVGVVCAERSGERLSGMIKSSSSPSRRFLSARGTLSVCRSAGRTMAGLLGRGRRCGLLVPTLVLGSRFWRPFSGECRALAFPGRVCVCSGALAACVLSRFSSSLSHVWWRRWRGSGSVW